MPGHKGRQGALFGESAILSASQDLTELEGLDDLSAPTGAIAAIECRAAALWGSGHALISINGASAAIMAAILATAQSGTHTHILVPRHAHRSVINAICLAGLAPIWYEADFDESWGLWGESHAGTIARSIEAAQAQFKTSEKIACAIVVSPTYAGALSDIAAIARVTAEREIPLIVDEAHGAHLTGPNLTGAIACGADATIHSWHKTLPALTQTGMLHLRQKGRMSAASARSYLNILSTSSPSYLLLASMEKSLAWFEKNKDNLLDKFDQLSTDFENGLHKGKPGQYSIYSPTFGKNPSHILLKSNAGDADEARRLSDYLQGQGIFTEAVMGSGVLFMLGAGSLAEDVKLALEAILDYKDAEDVGSRHKKTIARRPDFQPLMPPHEAMGKKIISLPSRETLGMISAQCLAPCPPGIPILIPGQKVTEEVLQHISDKTIMVVAPEGRSLLVPGETN
jgi:arginine decarboxylase